MNLDNIRVFSFKHHRIGDKVCAAFQLDYYKQKEGYEYILVDPHANQINSFPIKYFFPQISDFVLEINVERNDELMAMMSERFHLIGFGNLWISGPSLLHDTKFLPKMHIPNSVKQYQQNELNEFLENNVNIIVVHCLVDAPYNSGRNHNYEQFENMMKYIKETSINNTVIIPIPSGMKHPIWQYIGLINACTLYIGGDTGFTHIAAALDKDIIAIYGDDSHDIRAFHNEKERMGCSHEWCSDPLSFKYKKFIMKDHLFNEEEVFAYIKEMINKKNDQIDEQIEYYFTSKEYIVITRSNNYVYFFDYAFNKIRVCQLENIWSNSKSESWIKLNDEDIKNMLYNLIKQKE